MRAKARPQEYAAAIYDLALEPWTRQLTNVQKALKQDAALRTTLRDGGTSTQKKLERLSQAVPGGLGGEAKKFLGTLLEADQLDQLDAILAEFERLVLRRPERRLAQVTSAVSLTREEQETFRAKLAERFGADLDFQFEIDPALIGGVYLRVGDQVIDGSIAGKLAALRDRLTA